MGNLQLKCFLWTVILLLPILAKAQVSIDTTFTNSDSQLIKNDSTQIRHFYQMDSSIIIQDSSMLANHDTLVGISDSSNLVQDDLVLDYFLRKDSTDVYIYHFGNDSINYTIKKYVDTLNHTSGDYNPVKYFNMAFNDLGIMGSAQDNQIFNPPTQSGFTPGINSYSAFMWNPKNVFFYDTQTPYAKLFYLMGPKKEQSLKIEHAQSFLDHQLSIHLNFQLYYTIGAYNHQQTDVKRFYGGFEYHTKDSRYQAKALYYNNKQKLEENGGIANIKDFENNIERNRQIIETNLSTGENFIRKFGYQVNQSFYLSSAEPNLSGIPDTNLIQFDGYSVTHFKKPYFDPVSHLGRINYHFNYEQHNYRYTDSEQDSTVALYDHIPFYPTPDSSIFFDSIGMKKYQNEFTYSNSDYKDNAFHPKFLNYFFGGRHEYNEYYQDSVKKYFTHYAIIGGIFINLSKYISVLSDAEYYIGDYMNNDMTLNGKVNIRYKLNFLTAGIKINHRSADWIYHSYSSSRFTWENNFDKTDIQRIFIKFKRKNLFAFLQIENINGFVYFNENIVPEQSSDNIQHILVQVQKNLRLGPWGTDVRVNYQSVSHPNTIRVPKFSGKMKLFYQNNLFRNALGLEIGFEVSYFTKYYANRYMPALRSFHIQNELMIGDYPYIDVYLNAKIGKARLFIRYDHLNAGMMGYTFYASPYYPAQDASFRFGVTWILFN